MLIINEHQLAGLDSLYKESSFLSADFCIFGRPESPTAVYQSFRRAGIAFNPQDYYEAYTPGSDYTTNAYSRAVISEMLERVPQDCEYIELHLLFSLERYVQTTFPNISSQELFSNARIQAWIINKFESLYAAYERNQEFVGSYIEVLKRYIENSPDLVALAARGLDNSSDLATWRSATRQFLMKEGLAFRDFPNDWRIQAEASLRDLFREEPPLSLAAASSSTPVVRSNARSEAVVYGFREFMVFQAGQRHVFQDERRIVHAMSSFIADYLLQNKSKLSQQSFSATPTLGYKINPDFYRKFIDELANLPRKDLLWYDISTAPNFGPLFKTILAINLLIDNKASSPENAFRQVGLDESYFPTCLQVWEKFKADGHLFNFFTALFLQEIKDKWLPQLSRQESFSDVTVNACLDEIAEACITNFQLGKENNINSLDHIRMYFNKGKFNDLVNCFMAINWERQKHRQPPFSEEQILKNLQDVVLRFLQRGRSDLVRSWHPEMVSEFIKSALPPHFNKTPLAVASSSSTQYQFFPAAAAASASVSSSQPLVRSAAGPVSKPIEPKNKSQRFYNLLETASTIARVPGSLIEELTESGYTEQFLEAIQRRLDTCWYPSYPEKKVDTGLKIQFEQLLTILRRDNLINITVNWETKQYSYQLMANFPIDTNSNRSSSSRGPAS